VKTDGHRREGKFKDNELDGIGKEIYSDGTTLEGEFKKGSFTDGRIITHTEHVYSGVMIGKFHTITPIKMKIYYNKEQGLHFEYPNEKMNCSLF
jgi:hypothetical protein